MRCLLLFAVMLSCPEQCAAQPPKATPGNRLAYLDELDPYYPHAKFPKLITPQWVGEEGVEAVVILAIDDMRDPKKYEAYLRPILRRLQKIDGRAPVSIMTCSVKPDDPQLQTWLKEGLSIECHTVDHPCPFFKIGFEKAKSTYDRCVDLMNEIPGNKPVAFRMPCCDSLNTPSPRHWAEIFNKTTAKGNFLSIDSSVFVYYTSDDAEPPKSLTLDAEGKERFKRYLPLDRSFVNTIENYPYPYVIGNLCWQFPCMTPSDWQAQHLQKPNNPKTVEDWKAALDCTVIKQGVFNMVFHPHGWIRNDQVVEFIDHAVAKHGKKVKFLNFREAEERLSKGRIGPKHWRIRQPVQQKNVTMHAGSQEVDVLGNRAPFLIGGFQDATAVTTKSMGKFVRLPFNLPPGARLSICDGRGNDYGLRFRDLNADGKLDIIFSNEKEYGIYLFTDMEKGWSKKVLAGKRGAAPAPATGAGAAAAAATQGPADELPMISRHGTNNGFWVHSGYLWWSNEDTAFLKDHVDRRKIADLLRGVAK
ncbi:MAG: polysaccharide deacetylase family protein [Gemmataceae bacterium]|nr:polysaccharide deacetylase family protein [Gemmataceae bacterium]